MTTTEKMLDLGIEFLEVGIIRLEQSSGCGETVLIDLHPCQLRLLAERAGLLEPVPAATWPRGFQRRIERLRNHAENLWQLLDSVPCCPPDSGPGDDVIAAGELLDEFDDLLADFFGEEKQCHDESRNVTHEKAEPREQLTLT